MKKLSRRSFVHTLARGAMLGAAAPLLSSLGGCRNNRTTLNVVLHGLFIMNITDTQIELLTPYVVDHYYGAGNWNKDEICKLGKDGKCPPDKDGTYHLRGVDENRPPSLGSDANITLSQLEFNFKVVPEKSFFRVLLPYPQRVAFLRRVIDGDNTFPTPGGTKTAQIRTFALCPALVYPVADYHALELTNTTWKPKVEATRTANLHLWAEPPKRLTPGHADAAFRALSDLFDCLTVQLKTIRSVALDRYPAVYGVSSEEEQGLSEWISGGETSHPTNCNVVITTP